MRYFIITLVLLSLSACTTNIPEKNPTTSTSSGNAVSTHATNSTKTIVGETDLVSVEYTLRLGSFTGEIKDTNRKEDAMKMPNFNSGTTFKPLLVEMNTSKYFEPRGMTVVPGFRAGLIGMKKGERKSFEVSPKDGYGETMITRTIMKNEIAPKFTTTVDKRIFSDTITEVVEKSALEEQGTNLEVGKTLTGGNGITAKVLEIKDEFVTLEIANPNNPFKGKKIAVGASAKVEGLGVITIKSLTSTGVTVEIKNENSPFTERTFLPGNTGIMKDPISGSGISITIVSFSGETAEIKIPNPHDLAGKTLYFDVTVLDIQ